LQSVFWHSLNAPMYWTLKPGPEPARVGPLLDEVRLPLGEHAEVVVAASVQDLDGVVDVVLEQALGSPPPGGTDRSPGTSGRTRAARSRPEVEVPPTFWVVLVMKSIL